MYPPHPPFNYVSFSLLYHFFQKSCCHYFLFEFVLSVLDVDNFDTKQTTLTFLHRLSWLRWTNWRPGNIFVAEKRYNIRIQFVFVPMFPLRHLGKTSIKKNVFFRPLPEWGGGGGLPMPEFFGPFSRSAFLVNKKSLFLQECQCIELSTVLLG